MQHPAEKCVVNAHAAGQLAMSTIELLVHHELISFTCSVTVIGCAHLHPAIQRTGGECMPTRKQYQGVLADTISIHVSEGAAHHQVHNLHAGVSMCMQVQSLG